MYILNNDSDKKIRDTDRNENNEMPGEGISVEDNSIDEVKNDGASPKPSEGSEGVPEEDMSTDDISENTNPSDDETDTDDENKNEYYTKDEDDIAYVAERITGARHSNVTTAAPVRIREAGETAELTSLRRMMDSHAAQNIEHGTHRRKKKSSKVFGTLLSAAIVVLILLTCFVAGVNIAHMREESANKRRDADILMNADGTTESGTEIKVPANTAPETTNKGKTDTEVDPANGESTGESAKETETETEPETEPEPIKYSVKLDFFDRDDLEVSTEAITLRQLLEECDITLAENDVPSLPLDSVIAADVTVTIDKYEYKTLSESVKTAYSTEVRETDFIPRGNVNTIQEGEEGEVRKYYTVEYINGVETNRKFSYEEVVKYPVGAIYEKGVGGSFTGSDGVEYTYSYRRVVPATYYNIEGLTYLGTMADESVIAVDMNYIPLGTKLYVKNAKYDFGVRIASDIGSAITEWEIDIWIGADNPQLKDFAFTGYHYDMEIYYID